METQSAATTDSRILGILEHITGTDQVWRDRDLDLFQQGLLDSLGLVELLVALSDEFNIDLSPSEIERDQWASPRKISTYLQERLEA